MELSEGAKGRLILGPNGSISVLKWQIFPMMNCTLLNITDPRRRRKRNRWCLSQWPFQRRFYPRSPRPNKRCSLVQIGSITRSLEPRKTSLLSNRYDDSADCGETRTQLINNCIGYSQENIWSLRQGSPGFCPHTENTYVFGLIFLALPSSHKSNKHASSAKTKPSDIFKTQHDHRIHPHPWTRTSLHRCTLTGHWS